MFATFSGIKLSNPHHSLAMKNSTLTFFLLFFVAGTFAQVGFYKTYTDFEENNLTPMDEFVEIKNAGNAFNIWFMKGGKKVKVLSEDVWGFRNKGDLYRLAVVNGVDVPVRILYSGDGETNMCLYVPYQTAVKNENGQPIIDWNKQVMAYGMVFNWCFLSKNLSSSITYCGVGSGGYVDDFRDNNPQFKTYFECTGKQYKDSQLLVDCYRKIFPAGTPHF